MTNPTPEQIAHVLELVRLNQEAVAALHKVESTNRGSFEHRVADDHLHSSNYELQRAAPLMAQIIRRQQEQLRLAREALESIKNNAGGYDDGQVCHPEGCDSPSIAKQALSLIGDKS